MKVRSLMNPDPITIRENATVQEAIELMKINAIRHLPVVAENNQMRGLVTLADLKQGLIPYMMGDLSLTDLMIRNPVSVKPDHDIEIAAQLIYKHKISGMPVVENTRLVGIITETDILRTFIDLMGILTSSSRIDVVVGEDTDALARALQIIHDNGGDVINVTMTAQPTRTRQYYFRLTPCNTRRIVEALEAAGYQVLDAMD